MSVVRSEGDGWCALSSDRVRELQSSIASVGVRQTRVAGNDSRSADLPEPVLAGSAGRGAQRVEGRDADARVIQLPYPMSVNRIWVINSRRHGMTLSAVGRNWKKNAEWVARSYWRRMPLNGPVQVTLTLRPKANKDGSASKLCIDLDNACKVVLDCLQGICYENDKQIEVLLVTKGEPKEGGGVDCEVVAL